MCWFRCTRCKRFINLIQQWWDHGLLTGFVWCSALLDILSTETSQPNKKWSEVMLRYNTSTIIYAHRRAYLRGSLNYYNKRRRFTDWTVHYWHMKSPLFNLCWPSLQTLGLCCWLKCKSLKEWQGSLIRTRHALILLYAPQCHQTPCTIYI